MLSASLNKTFLSLSLSLSLNGPSIQPPFIHYHAILYYILTGGSSLPTRWVMGSVWTTSTLHSTLRRSRLSTRSSLARYTNRPTLTVKSRFRTSIWPSAQKGRHNTHSKIRTSIASARQRSPVHPERRIQWLPICFTSVRKSEKKVNKYRIKYMTSPWSY